MQAPYYQRDGLTIYHASFQDLVPELARLGAVFDCVITDPPYPKQFLPLWTELAFAAGKLLRTGGSLLALMPQYAMPQILAAVGYYLKWRWCCAQWQGEGAHPRMAMGVEVLWKPMGWWVQGSYDQRRGYRRDGFVSEGRDKSHHAWQQGQDWANYALDFVAKGGLVLDPMMGPGTLLVAARDRGIECVGIDEDEAACAAAVARLEA